MGIRIEHQPSPYAAGLAAWQTGQGAARERQQKYALNLFAQDRATRAQREQQFGDRMTKGFGAAVAGLPQVPDYAPPETANRLGKLIQSANILATGVHGTGPQAQWKLQGLIEEINDTVGAIPQPDPVAEAQKGMMYLDPNDGRLHKDFAPGRTIIMGGRVMPPSQQQIQQQQEQQAEQKRLENEQKAEQQKADAHRKAATDLAEKMAHERNMELPADAPELTALDFIEEADEYIRKINEGLENFWNPESPSEPSEPQRVKVSPTGSPVQPTGPAQSPAGGAPASGPSGTPAIPQARPSATGLFDDSSRGMWSIEDQLNLGGLDKGIESDFNQMLKQPQPAVPWGDAQPAPREIGDVQGVSPEQLRQFRIGAERPSTRTALEQEYGMEFKPIDEIYPDAPQPERPPVHSIEQEHVTAQTAPRMGQPDPARVGQLHERVSAIPNRAVADRTRGTAAGAASDRALGMTPMQRTMGGVSTQPHVSQQRQAEMQAVSDSVRAAAQQQEVDREARNANLEERAAESMKRSEEALARSRALPPRKYHVPKTTEARTSRLARKDASKKMRQTRGIAKGNVRKAQLGKPPADFRQVSSPEQVDKLPLGTYYILPDGKIRQKRTQ